MATNEASGIGHPMNAPKAILMASPFLFPASALPQSVEKEPAAVVELGGGFGVEYQRRRFELRPECRG